MPAICTKQKMVQDDSNSAARQKAYARAVVMHIDVTQLRVMEQERLHAKKEEQRIITKAILTGQERERNHIGRELHDNINQLLTGTKYT